MQFSARTVLITTTFVFFSVLSTGCSNSDQMGQSSSGEIVVTQTATATRQAPATDTLTPSPTHVPPTETPTPTFTPTDTPTPTQTEVPPELAVIQNAICYSGPAFTYEIVAYFQASDPLILRGRLEDQSWWQVQGEYLGEEITCWLQKDFVTLSGNPALLPVVPPPPTLTPSPSPTPEAVGGKYYLLALNTGGPFGCGDSLVYFTTGNVIRGAQKTEEKILDALNTLFSYKTKFVGEYYNPIYESNLKAKRVVIENNQMYVYLSGKFVHPKNECEAQRIRDQIWSTAGRIDIGYRITIYVNNALLGDLLLVTRE